MFLRLLKNVWARFKRVLWLVPLIPASSFADSNPFDVMGINDELQDKDIVTWFKELLQTQYMPLILGTAGLLILASSAMHIHHVIKKSKEEGSQSLMSEITGPMIAAIIGIAIIGLGFTINNAWT